MGLDEFLKKYRKKIDRIDSDLIRLLEKRAEISKIIGNYKKSKKIKISDKNREKQILKKLRIKSNKTNKKYINQVFKAIIKHSKKIQK